MRVFRKILYIVLCVVDVYFTYSWIGYLVLGIKHPTIYGETNTNFMGMYIMSITFFVLFALLSTLLLVWGIKYIKRAKNRENNIEFGSHKLSENLAINANSNATSIDKTLVALQSDENVLDNEASEIVQDKEDTKNKENGEIL